LVPVGDYFLLLDELVELLEIHPRGQIQAGGGDGDLFVNQQGIEVAVGFQDGVIFQDIIADRAALCCLLDKLCDLGVARRRVDSPEGSEGADRPA